MAGMRGLSFALAAMLLAALLTGCMAAASPAATSAALAANPSAAPKAVVTPADVPGPTSQTLSPALMTPQNISAEPNLPEFTQDEIAAAKAVVLDYFKAEEARDKDAVLKTLTSWHDAPNMMYFEEETRKLMTVDYDPQDRFRRTYITNGRGRVNGATVENVIVFKVSFDVTYPGGEVTGSFNQGLYRDWSMILIREGADKPWLIDDQGY